MSDVVTVDMTLLHTTLLDKFFTRVIIMPIYNPSSPLSPFNPFAKKFLVVSICIDEVELCKWSVVVVGSGGDNEMWSLFICILKFHL